MTAEYVAKASEAEGEAGALDEAAEAAPDATGPTLPPGFHAYCEAMERLIVAAQDGGVIEAADLQRSTAFRQVIERLRRGGHLPDGMARPLLEFRTRLDAIEAVAHNRDAAAAAAAARVLAAGEELARRILVRRGYRNVVVVINRFNNGVDLIEINRAGMVRVFEVKASAGARAPALSAPQRSAREFALSRLRLIEARRGPYATATETMRATARTMLAQLDRQGYVGGAIFEVTLP